MFLGRQRHDRAVALGLAAALLGSLVLGLLVTLAAARGSGDSGATPVSTPSATPAPTQAWTNGRGAQSHEDDGTADDGPLGIHPGLLVASIVGVVLLFGTGFVVHVTARRRAERGDDDPDDASYGDPWDRRHDPRRDERDEQWDERWDET